MKINNPLKTVASSPWPFMFTIISWSVMMNIISMLNNQKYPMELTVILMISITMKWTMNNIKENNSGSMILMINYMKHSTLIIISSEILFFSSMFYTHLSMTLFNNLNINMKNNPMNLNMYVAFINLITLLTSSLTFMVYTKNKMINNNKWMLTTIMLSLYFILIQNMEFYNMKFNINNSMIFSNFYMLTMFHMTHVMIGSTLMAMIMYMKIKLHPIKTLTKLTLWYWHFVDLIWILIFTLIYYFMNMTLYIWFPIKKINKMMPKMKNLFNSTN